MLKKERQNFILHRVNLHNKVLSSALSHEMNVSEDTIRRDLQELADEGRLIKVHGGALSRSFHHHNLPDNEIYSFDHKRSIAVKAIDLIADGMFVLTTGGNHRDRNGKGITAPAKGNIHFRFDTCHSGIHEASVDRSGGHW